jgi:hypothetical protein
MIRQLGARLRFLFDQAAFAAGEATAGDLLEVQREEEEEPEHRGARGALTLEDEIRRVASAATPRAGDGGHSS